MVLKIYRENLKISAITCRLPVAKRERGLQEPTQNWKFHISDIVPNLL